MECFFNLLYITYFIVGVLSKQMHLHNGLSSAVDKMHCKHSFLTPQVFVFIQEEKNPLTHMACVPVL